MVLGPAGVIQSRVKCQRGGSLYVSQELARPRREKLSNITVYMCSLLLRLYYTAYSITVYCLVVVEFITKYGSNSRLALALGRGRLLRKAKWLLYGRRRGESGAFRPPRMHGIRGKPSLKPGIVESGAARK